MPADTNHIPSDPKEREKMKGMLTEITHRLRQIDDNREAMKEIADEVVKTYGIQKKTVTKLARTMYKHNYADLQSENEHFEILYESLVEGKKTPLQQDLEQVKSSV